jgi:hypothetical protein
MQRPATVVEVEVMSDSNLMSRDRPITLLRSQITVQAESPPVARRTLFPLSSYPAFIQAFWEQRWLNLSCANMLSRGWVNIAVEIAVADAAPAQM